MAERIIGIIHFWGHGVVIDYPRAKAAYEKAAAQDDCAACVLLGDMYSFSGQGVTPSLRRVREYYGRAIKQGSSEAADRLAFVEELVPQVMSQRSNYSHHHVRGSPHLTCNRT